MAAPSGNMPVICVPGQRLNKVEENINGGPGTYIKHGYIYASLAGYVDRKNEQDGKVSIEVRTEVRQNIVPSVGSLVTARVTNVNPRFCKCSIVAVEGTALRETFRGVIRKEDVKATLKDRVEMYKCFRPSDIVLARVITLGDAHSYHLSTAENELGVIVAVSEAGSTMVPISWCEMQCPKTQSTEFRKVAKAQPEHIQ